MARLDAKAAKAVSQSDAITTGGFEPLTPGKYLAKLREVSIRDNPDKYGAAQWSAEFDNLHMLETQESAPGRQWLNLTVPLGSKVPSNYQNGPDKWEKYQNMVKGRLKAFFEAFGYTTDSDTDEMLGEWAVLTVGIRTIQGGPREGEKTNVVNGIESIDEFDIDFGEFGIDEDDEDETF